MTKQVITEIDFAEQFKKDAQGNMLYRTGGQHNGEQVRRSEVRFPVERLCAITGKNGTSEATNLFQSEVNDTRLGLMTHHVFGDTISFINRSNGNFTTMTQSNFMQNRNEQDIQTRLDLHGDIAFGPLFPESFRAEGWDKGKFSPELTSALAKVSSFSAFLDKNHLTQFGYTSDKDFRTRMSSELSIEEYGKQTKGWQPLKEHNIPDLNEAEFLALTEHINMVAIGRDMDASRETARKTEQGQQPKLLESIKQKAETMGQQVKAQFDKIRQRLFGQKEIDGGKTDN